MRREGPSPELDLVPVMNLVTILIPFLLMASGMVAIAVVDTSLPAQSDKATASDIESHPQILIGNHQLAVIDPSGGRTDLSCSGRCQTPADIDLDGLTTALEGIRPTSGTTVTLAPADGVPYELIIAVMDASREADFPEVVMAAGG